LYYDVPGSVLHALRHFILTITLQKRHEHFVLFVDEETNYTEVAQSTNRLSSSRALAYHWYPTTPCQNFLILSLCFSLSLSNTGVRTQGLLLARQALYHLSHSTSLCRSFLDIIHCNPLFIHHHTLIYTLNHELCKSRGYVYFIHSHILQVLDSVSSQTYSRGQV
jgi:hypothetical protein